MLDTGNHSVIIGEFNFPGLGKFIQTDAERKWMEETLVIVNTYGLSYMAFHMDSWKLGLIKRNGSPTDGAGPYPLTVRGGVIFNDLQKYPPTQFDK